MNRVRVILGWLLAGAVVNVAVAWGIAASRNVTERLEIDQHYRVLHHADGSWYFYQNSEPGSAAIRGVGDRSRQTYVCIDAAILMNKHPAVPIDSIPRWSGPLHLVGTGKPLYIEVSRTDVARGWPLLTLVSQVHEAFEGEMPFTQQTEGGFRVSEFSGAILTNRVLPYRPIWPGFAANLLFYALILWGAFVGVRGAHHALRRRHGLCVCCAYDLRGAEHDACPECGGTA